jgi:hypothetical protein
MAATTNGLARRARSASAIARSRKKFVMVKKISSC